MNASAFLCRSLMLLPFLACHALAADWTYAVRPGDTLIDVANAYMAKPQDWPRLQELNRVPDPKHLVPGSELRIPVGWLRQGAAVATVIHLQGDVRRAAQGGGSPLKTGDTLVAGETVQTGNGGTVSLRFFDGSRLLVTPNSRVFLSRLHQYGRTGMAETAVRVAAGSVATQVAKQQGPAADYRIESQALNLGVRGTDFRVGVEANGLTHSEVLGGRVMASAPAAEARGIALDPGFGTVAGAGQTPASAQALEPAPKLQGLPERVEHLPLRFQWANQPGATKWRAQVFAEANPDALLLDGVFTEPTAQWADLPDGRYRLKVRAVAASGLEGLDSEHAFAVAAVRLGAPMTLAPRQGQRIRGATLLQWARPANAERFHLQVAASADFAAPVVDRDDLTDTELTLTLASGRYYWRVAGMNPNGGQGPFSAVSSFDQRVIPTPPNTISAESDGDATVLRWPAGEQRQNYHVQVARDAAFTDLVETRYVDQPTFRLPRSGGGRYFVRVCVVDADGFVGPYGPAQAIDVSAFRLCLGCGRP